MLAIATWVVSVLAVSTAAAYLHVVRSRWVSPYSRFRDAAARVTGSGQSTFRVAGAQMARSVPSQ